MGSLTVSLTPSLSPKMTLTKFVCHVTRRVSIYLFILSSVLSIFETSVINKQNLKKSIPHVYRTFAARLPHVYRTCGCTVNLPHNPTCGAASLGVSGVVYY